jgi:sugar/nucleoside kinase (ribokinase family)
VIALIGQSVVDTTFWPDGRVEHRLGGAPIFAARALAGTAAVVLTHGVGGPIARPLHDCGLEVCRGPSHRPTVFKVTLHGDGTWHESISALGETFTPEDVATWMAPTLSRCSTVVCGAQWRDDFPAETLALLRAGGRTVYLDGQGLTRPQRLGPVHLESPENLDALEHVDVLKLSEEEADTLIGGIDPAAARDTGVPVVVVTRAEQGAVLLAAGLAITIAVDAVFGLADTVGAGDSFLALMATAAAAGADPVYAARQACAGVARLLRKRLTRQTRPDSVAADRLS